MIGVGLGAAAPDGTTHNSIIDPDFCIKGDVGIYDIIGLRQGIIYQCFSSILALAITFWWMPPCQHPVAAYFDRDFIVDVEGDDACAPDRSTPRHLHALRKPREVLMPIVGARII